MNELCENIFEVLRDTQFACNVMARVGSGQVNYIGELIVYDAMQEMIDGFGFDV